MSAAKELFDPPAPPSKKTTKPVDLITKQAREILAAQGLHMPEDWHWCSIEAIYEGDVDTGTTQITGAVPSVVLYKGGPNKGKPNHKHRTYERSVFVPHGALAKYRAKWMRENDGKCERCGGDGIANYDDDKIGDRPCNGCKGTGKGSAW